jgi:hypothetical protein
VQSYLLKADSAGRMVAGGGVGWQVVPYGGAMPVTVSPDEQTERAVLVLNDRPHYCDPFKRLVITSGNPGGKYLVNVLQKDDGIGGVALDWGLLLDSGNVNVTAAAPYSPSLFFDVRGFRQLLLAVNLYDSPIGVVSSITVGLRMATEVTGASGPVNDYTATMTSARVLQFGDALVEVDDGFWLTKSRRFPFARVALSITGTGTQPLAWWLYALR